MKDMKVLDFRDFYIIISKINGKTVTVDKETYCKHDELETILHKKRMYETPKIRYDFDKELFNTIFISIHASSKCNLSCDYCFMKDRVTNNLSFEQVKTFIDDVIKEYPNAGKYIVDPTGSGEPLLNKSLIYDIGEYCKIKSNEMRREVLPMIATNGTLLDSSSVQELREAGILFGVSLDGDKKSNDTYRKDFNGNGVYKRVIKNIKRIQDRSLMGVAVTLTDKNTNLVGTLRHLIKYFPTISIKPVRSLEGNLGITNGNIEAIKEEYTKLFDFLVNETVKGNLYYLAALLNGDDYFGKFLLRTILKQRVTTRCDAGTGRFSLAQDGFIYSCPGAIGIKELRVGTLKEGISDKSRKDIYSLLIKREKCGDCFARFVCGGECMVSSYYLSGKIDELDSVMCSFKKHLYKLSLLFHEIIKDTNHYVTIYNACKEKKHRFDEDIKITSFLQRNPEVTFMDIKMNRDQYEL